MKLIFKIAFFVGFGILSISYSNAQAPVILSVDKYIDTDGGRVTLVGSNFGTNPANLVVFFGGAKGTILSATNQIIEARVPAGAIFDNITVTNITTGLTGFSDDQFLLSYGGEHPFDITNMEGQFDFPGSSGLYDLCMADLDGDGKNDIVSAGYKDAPASTKFSLSRNTGSVGTINFTQSVLDLAIPMLHVKIGDINGDGKPDIVFSEGRNGNRISILKNNSTPGNFSFSNLPLLTLTGVRPKRIEIVDIDLDGKPELILTDQGLGKITILPNTSTLANITFSAPQTVTVTGATNTDGLAIEDINGDHLPDIVVNQILQPNVFILQNNSTPGNIKLENKPALTLSGNIANVRVGDLDGDNKPDIAVTRWLSAGISVFLNQGTNGQIFFSSVTNIGTEIEPWGIDFGDLDGDMKKDIVIASTQKTLTVLNNESTPGSLSFQKSALPTTFLNRHISIGDLDGDAKPDIAFTSVDDDNLNILPSKISVFRNKNCLVPKIDQTGPLFICSSYTLRLNSNASAGVTYDWKKDGTTVATGANAFFDVTASGQYTVNAISEGGTCNKISNAVDITIVTEPPAGTVIFNNGVLPVPPVCINSTLNLPVSSTNATDYVWRGPGGFSYNGSPLVRTGFQAENAGVYDVDIKIGTCIAGKSSVVVEAVSLPDFKVSYTGSEVVCSGDSKTLNASPSSAGFTYQWFEKINGLITGETSSSYSTATSGEFYYQATSITSPACPAVESNSVKISVVATPLVAFDAPAESCRNGIVQFTNQSVTDSQATPSYTWDFDDGQTSNSESPTHTFSTIRTFNVKFSVSYAGGSCLEEIIKPIKISAAPVASITTPTNTFKFCPGENLKLEVNGAFNSYLWSTSENTPSITISQPDTYIADVTTAGGCKLSLSQKVDAFPSPQVIVTATPNQISSGEQIQLSASGLTNYDWNPGKMVSDSTLSSPTALPLQTIQYSVTGKDNNGCPGEGQVEVIVKGESAVSKLKPSNFFSPNGDAVNNLWSVDNILGFPQCTVTIYDDKGIKLYEAKPYMNDWDGSFQGKLLPNGVYFYIIRCEGEESAPKTGSITLIR